MRINIINEGIDIISNNNDLVVYRTVDGNLVFLANSKHYKEIFQESSTDITEQAIYSELYNLMCSIQKKNESDDICKTDKYCENVSLQTYKYSPKCKSDILTITRIDGKILLELKKLKESSMIPHGKVEISQPEYIDLFFKLYDSLAKDAININDKSVQKVKKI